MAWFGAWFGAVFGAWCKVLSKDKVQRLGAVLGAVWVQSKQAKVWCLVWCLVWC